jgi:hypothetical protein
MRYILPVIPAASLMAAFIFIYPEDNKVFYNVKRIILLFFKFAPPVILAAAWIAFAIISGLKINIEYPLISISITFLILSYATIVFAQKQKTSEAKEFALIATGAITFLSLHLLLVEPLIQSLEGSRTFVELAEKFRDGGKRLVFYRIGPDGEDIKYMINVKKPFKPDFIWEFEELFEMPDSIAIVKESDYKKLPDKIKAKCNILANGKLGHRETLALQPQIKN